MNRIAAFVVALQVFFGAVFGVGLDHYRTAVEISKNEFAVSAYQLSTLLQKQCYNPLTHKLNQKTDQEGMPYVWPAASYVEMLSDAYRLYPGDLRLRLNYKDALKKLLPKYLAVGQTVNPPTGAVSGVSYYNSSAGSAGDFYYDDNEWVCIQLLLGYRNLKDASLLSAAEENLAFLKTGWDDAAGGIYWSSAYNSKNACSNAPAAIAFLLAYQITGKQEYLAFGKAIYDFMNRTMRHDDLFIDNLALDGTVGNYWKGAYNQATMIYAGSLLYEITGENTYYDLTKATMNASLPHMFRQVETEGGTKTVRMNGNPIFKAWCIGWLARSYVKFYELDPEKDGAAMAMLTSVMRDELVTKDENGLYDPYFCSGGKDPDNYTELLAQCGVACTLLNTAYYDVFLK